MVQCFGNDILWRELANINRAMFYWKDGEMKDVPQRKVLCVLDAVSAGNGSHGGGPKVKVGAVLASVDPIAVDAVGSRLMRYDFRSIPPINNAPSVPSHPWGTNDPAAIRLVGDMIGPKVGLLFSNPFDKEKEFKQVVIDDLEPPAVAEPVIEAKGGKLTASVKCEGACTVFLYCTRNGATSIVRMARQGDTFTAAVPAGPAEFRLVAQDRFFNSTQSGPFKQP